MKFISMLAVVLLVASCSGITQHNHHRGLASSSEKPQIDQVFAAVTGNFNSDPYSDIAFLIDNPNNEEYFELWIYLTTSKGHGSRQLALKNTQFIYKVTGQFVSVGEPSLSKQTFEETEKPDSLVISAEYMGIGRSASFYQVKFAYRDSKFLTAGIEWQSFDKLQEYGSKKCSFNLLRGKYSNGINRTLRDIEPKYVRKDASQVSGRFFEDVVSLCPEQK